MKSDTTAEYSVFISPYNKKGALKDIEMGRLKLLLPGGISTAPKLHSDSIFENKYNVVFISQGCVRSAEDNQTEYNNEIFKYLDKTYGRDWRKEVRKDVIGQ